MWEAVAQHEVGVRVDGRIKPKPIDDQPGGIPAGWVRHGEVLTMVVAWGELRAAGRAPVHVGCELRRDVLGVRGRVAERRLGVDPVHLDME
eukprot:scaffold12257_cov141-Isochrysis_galbana.AAC.9